MAQVLVRNLPDSDVETLRMASDKAGRSLEGVLREIITEAARRERLQSTIAKGGAIANRIMERWVAMGNKSEDFPRAVDLIREDRDR